MMEKITGKTKSGFEFSVPDGLSNDFRFVKAYRNYKSRDPEKQVDGICDMISAVFSDEVEEERFYQHIARTYGDDSGRVPADRVLLEITEITDIIHDDVKN